MKLEWDSEWECTQCSHKVTRVDNIYTVAEDWEGVVVCVWCGSNMKRRKTNEKDE